jgi:uncharacterized membrane protein
MFGDSSNSHILFADSRDRRRLLALAIIGSILVAWVVGWLAPFVRHEARLAIAEGRLHNSVVCQAALIVLGFFSCGVAAFGVQARRIGKAVVAAGRFPPPDVSIGLHARVVTGRAATVIGSVQAVLGASLVVAAGVLFFLVLYGLGRLSFG